MIAQHAPELVEKLVIVDALPYYPAIQNPALTAELMRPQAEQIRAQMTNQTDDDFYRNAAASLGSMSNNPARLPTLTEWMKTSDRHTTAAAMYSMMVNDLRQSLGNIKAPTLVLGAWAAYKNFGATKDSTQAVFAGQYAALKQVDIRLSDTGFHFLMWDDASWLQQQISDFIK
jgi:pimeloyl-ACP methyl ester carboxylesterase